MEMKYVNSSMIRGIGYDPETETMRIEFTSDGSIWEYEDVPETEADAFQRSGSKGRFFHDNIKGQYNEQRIR